MSMRQPPFHYAWVIIGLSVLLYLAGGSITQAFGVVIIPLQEQRGWSQGSITLAYGISAVVSAGLSPLTGIATDRYGGRVVLWIGVAAFFIGTVISAVATEVWHIWVSYGFFLGITHSSMNVALITTATYWFKQKLGIGVGLLQFSQGIGPAGTTLLIGILLESYDWRVAFWVLGIGCGITMSLIVWFFRSKPSDVGLDPYGDSVVTYETQDFPPQIQKIREKVRASRVQATSSFWKLVLVHYLGCVSHAIVIVYIIPIAMMSGVSPVAAAGVLSTLSLVSGLTRFTTPVIADYLGPRGTMAVMFVLQGLPVMMLFWIEGSLSFYIFAVIFGIGYGGEGSAFPIINRRYYGEGSLGRSFGWQLCGAMLGMATGGWIGGVMFGIFGDYVLTIAMSVATSLAGAVVILSMQRTNKIIIEDWEDYLPIEAKSMRNLKNFDS
ncbi:MAG: MFS transporter [SAR202 cluster bacterium]|nr:MFS transporter [SAR202 cluster bacterium]|tara:strand:+ start:116 stop:1429 length:1314 start_codon:yes stop_codon:yes gene_type:complete